MAITHRPIEEEPMGRDTRTRFKEDLAELINKYNGESDSNTPDYILAEVMYAALEAFNHASRRREDHYGHRHWMPSVGEELAGIQTRTERVEEASPNDIRAKGWTVAIHNDYRQHDGPYTFWLFTHVESGRFVKGEGVTDADALNQVRAALAAPKP